MAHRQLDFFHFSYILGSDYLCALIICNGHYRQKNPEWLFIKKTAGEYHSLSLLDSDHPNYTNSIYYKDYLF